MYAGRIVEEGPVGGMLRAPRILIRKACCARHRGWRAKSWSRFQGLFHRSTRCRPAARSRRAAPPGSSRATRRCRVSPRSMSEARGPRPDLRGATSDIDHRISAESPRTRPGRLHRGRRSRRDAGAGALMPLLEVRHLVKEFNRRKGLFGKGPAVRAVDDVSFAIGARRNLRAGRRVGQRQDDDRTLHPAADRADLRRSDVRRNRRTGAVARRHAAGAARHADRVSGSVLVAQPAHARQRRRGRAADHPPDRDAGRTARAGESSCSSWSD